jgi:hypothetical protein
VCALKCFTLNVTAIGSELSVPKLSKHLALSRGDGRLRGHVTVPPTPPPNA